MVIGVTLIVISLLYTILISIIYFTKKRVNIFETRIYTILLLISVLGLVFELLCCYSVGYLMDRFTILNLIITKGFLVIIFYWMLAFTVYVFVVSNKKQLEGTSLGKKLLSLIIVAAIVISLILFILPLYYVNSNGIVYSYGPSTVFLYGLITLCMTVCVYRIIFNYKTIRIRKFLPVIVLVVIALIVMVIRAIDPSILIISTMMNFVTNIMYFTIENPDVKVIEELNVARDQADRANRAKTDFLSSMSHEIRTPLNAIVGFSECIKQEKDIDSCYHDADDIIMASQNLLEIVNGILDISKIEANKLEIVNTEYNFNKLLEELVSLTKAKIGEKPLEFKYSFSPDLPKYLYGDKVRVKQVILNLLTNAVKYTKKGWIDFRVNCVKKKDYCRLLISVQDTGIGIKPDSINKLFNKFERLDIEKNNTIEGTGLGLAITKKLLELMGGKIVVQSIYGEGSKFTVAIDQRIIDSPTNPYLEKTQELKIQDLNLVNRRILIVDDNIINLKVATRLLSDYHCIIDTLTSGVDCVDKISVGASYDLILMDDMMPKMSGTETLHKLQGIEDFNTPVVALTANAISGMREKYLSEGFSEYLSKPIDKVELNQVLNKFLR